MKKWYQHKYVNHRDWIFDNIEKFNLNNDELILLLLIDFLNTNNIALNTSILSKKMRCSEKEVDLLIEQLCLKNLLEIKAGKKLIYDLSKFFETDFNEIIDPHLKDVYQIYEKEFGRFLTKLEVEKLSDLINDYDKDKIIKALQKASAYNSLSMKYIESILKNDK